jgi:hypothetical protein
MRLIGDGPIFRGRAAIGLDQSSEPGIATMSIWDNPEFDKFRFGGL